MIMDTSDSRTLRGSLAEQLAPVAARLRGSYSVVRPVSQVTLELRRDHSADVFAMARGEVINWVKLRAGRPLPPQASKGEAFELEDVGSQRTAAVSIDQPRYWAARLDDSDSEVPQRSWVTEVGIAERADNTVILGVRLLCVTRGEDNPISPSIPRFVRTIVGRCPNVFLEGRKLDLVPWAIQSEEDVDTLVALIENQSRRLDVIVCALPEGSEDPATATVDVRQLHMRTLGAAHVAVITGPASFYLSDRVGKEFSVFRGAVRTYRSGFNVAQDEPFRHPLGLSNRIIEWPSSGRESYENFLIGQTLVRSASGHDVERQLPPFTEVRRVAAQLRLDAAKGASNSDADLLKLAEDEIRELRDSSEKDRATYQGLVDQYERERDQTREETQQAQAANGYLRQRIRVLETQLKLLSKNAGTVPIPSSLDQFESWCHDYLSGAVEVHNRAIQGAKKSRFEDYTLIYKALLLLRDAYVPMKRDGGFDKKITFEDGCKKLGLLEEATFTGVRWGEEGDTYLVRYAGRRCLLDRHLKKGTSKDERFCFRLYFFWDEESEQVVVGWLPSHLDTRIT
jgi:hypothetical protein